MTRILVTWFGATDLKAARGEGSGLGLGPVAQALAARTFDQVVLLTNYDKTDVALFEAWLKEKTKASIAVRSEKLRSPTDFGDIYKAVAKTVDGVRAKAGPKAKLTFHLSPGTPAMAAVWILVAPR